MHILLIPSWYPNSYNPLSGIFFKEQAESLAEFPGNKIGVIAVQEISLKSILKTGKFDFSFKSFSEKRVNTYIVQYPIFPKMFIFRNKLKLVVFKRLFEKYINKYGLPDIVHVHSFMHGELAIYIKKKYKIPYVVTEHSSAFIRNSLSKKQILIADKVFNHSSCNIAVSKEFSEYLSKQFKKDFIYIPNIVDVHYFQPKKEKNKLKEFRFINIAFLNKNKNQEMLIRAFTKSFKDKKGIILTIVGDGPEYNNLNNLIKELNMEKQIFLYGRANRKEVKEFLQNSNVFVLSSRYETFGVAIIEAMACGLPVIATKCGGPESIIANDKLGKLINANIDELSHAMIELYQNYNKFETTYIVKFIYDNFSKEAVVKKLMHIYNSFVYS